jgi:DNA-nicking Smr family endonuclease
MASNERIKSVKRKLATHEQELWALVTRHVKPMAGRRASVAALPSDKLQVSAVQTIPQTPKTRAPPTKPLAPLEPGVLRRLARGGADPQARIDLHGMRQAEAHQNLRGFLHRSHANGLRLTLVVTGKGSKDGLDFSHDERGVLRRMVPHWLAAPDLRHIVLGFTEAARRHGGEGALYVRLRSSNSSRIHASR